MSELRLPITKNLFCAPGPGGQHRNKTLSAVELSVTLPDGRVIRACSQKLRSQHQNMRDAKRILLARVRAALKPPHERPDLSERVRTYHGVRNEVLDHASGERRPYQDVLYGRAFDELVDARRRALEASA